MVEYWCFQHSITPSPRACSPNHYRKTRQTPISEIAEVSYSHLMKSPNVKPIIGVLMLLAILVAVATSHGESPSASLGNTTTANFTWQANSPGRATN